MIMDWKLIAHSFDANSWTLWKFQHLLVSVTLKCIYCQFIHQLIVAVFALTGSVMQRLFCPSSRPVAEYHSLFMVSGPHVASSVDAAQVQK